ncbi:MAG: nucleoside-diphosphate kinase, partial [Bacteroidota bacterium]
MEQTFFIIKPEAYKFKKEILEEIINEGTFNIISITDKQLKLDDIELIYANEKEPLKSALLQYLSSGIICAGIIEGKNVIDNFSKFSGSFGNPNNCEPSSLRFRYGDKKVHTYENVPVFHNAIHRSITINEAKESIDLYWTKIKHNDIIDDVKKLVISHLDCQERLIYHIEPVVNNAIFLANQLNANSQIVEIASYLHDITRMTGDRENHHISGSELSRDFLTSLNYPLTKTNLICDCILNHRGSKRL